MAQEQQALMRNRYTAKGNNGIGTSVMKGVKVQQSIYLKLFFDNVWSM